jgi:hypothetical protein
LLRNFKPSESSTADGEPLCVAVFAPLIRSKFSST